MNLLLWNIQQINNKVIEHVIEGEFNVDFIPLPLQEDLFVSWSDLLYSLI